MKQVPSRIEVMLPGNKKVVVVQSKWGFTPQEKNEIRRVLKNETSKEKIEAFINPLEELCIIKMLLLRGKSPKSEIRPTRERILIDCKTALRHLKRASMLQVEIWQHDTLDYLGLEGKSDDVSDFYIRLWDSAWGAIGPLDKFIKVIEEYHRSAVNKIGRKNADSDHFIRRIKSLYVKYIGKPKSYESGAFFSVVQVILETVGLPFADPSRAIKAALKSK